MILEQYWPGPDQVNACIKNEAETANVAVLLAVHQPTQFTTRNAITNLENSASEQELLDAFLSDDVPGGYLLFPITGPSGIGKSHVIRWLDAQLRRSWKSDKLHIIRIPKSASLRKVVELVLEPLAGDPRFDKPRSELSRAMAEVDERDIVVRFRAEIENALRNRDGAMQLELREHNERAGELRQLIGHARGLPTFFSDAALKSHFEQEVLAGKVARAVQGFENETEGNETQSQFSADDLILPDSVDLNAAALSVRTYYQTQLAVQDGKRRQAAADLLNSIVDTAIANVFRLEQSTGGTSLQDIMLGIREILLREDMDLVLLVEDFAALSGIQDVLLKVCIQEGTRDGKKVRATMRTALALTDGYLASRDTILTRAQRVWVIGNPHQTDSEIKNAAVDMVGAYLNAARWGEDGLERQFDRTGTNEVSTDWLSTWRSGDDSDSETEALAAFGFSSKSHALFPYNRLAIEQFVVLHLTIGGRLVLNPRRVINYILRPLLLMRASYLNGNFPPANLDNLRPNLYLAGLVRDSGQPSTLKGRLNSALAIWAGNAPDENALSQIPPSIFSSFALPTPADLAKIKFLLLFEPAQFTAPIVELPPVTKDPRIAEWERKLEAWASGTMLAQADANRVRNALAPMIQGAINWPALRIPEQEIKISWLSIANARGNQVGGRTLVVCDRHDDEDGTLREGFLGALRFAFNDNRWDYPEADIDYVASTAIVDRLVAQLVPVLAAEAMAQVSTIAQTLINQSRIIGLAPPVRLTSPGPLLRGLFSLPPLGDSHASEDGLGALRTQAMSSENGRDMRTKLQILLLERVASFQGTGNKPFAVDSPRLIDALSGETTNVGNDDVLNDVRAFIATMTETRLKSRIKPVIIQLSFFQKEIAEFIDDSFDKNAFISDLRNTIRLLVSTNCWPTASQIKSGEYEISLSEFHASRLVDLVEKVATIVGETDEKQTPRLLNAVGTIDLGLIERTLSFLNITREIISQAERIIPVQETLRGQSDPISAGAKIINLLTSISGPIDQIVESSV